MIVIGSAALSVHSAFVSEFVWIDLVLFVLFAFFHVGSNWSNPHLSNDANERGQSFTLVNGLAIGGVTAVGILLPLSLAAIQTFTTHRAAHANVLENIFLADAWLALSLSLGVLVLWVAGFQASLENALNSRLVRAAGGLQLPALLLGVVRLLIAAFLLVQAQN